jgi:hypothetical protein
MRRFACVLALSLLVGCGAVVRGGPLSDRGGASRDRIYLTTSGSPRPFKTLGFAQIRGYGVTVAGFADVGEAALDHTIKGRLAEEAVKMGGDGVINIEFLDENPPTDADRISDAANTVNSFQNPGQGGPQVKSRDRFVTVTGEIVKFTGP